MVGSTRGEGERRVLLEKSTLGKGTFEKKDFWEKGHLGKRTLGKRDLGKTKDAYFKDLGRQYIRVHSRFEFRFGPSNLSITFTTDQKYTSISSYLLQKLWIKSEKIGHF